MTQCNQGPHIRFSYSLKQFLETNHSRIKHKSFHEMKKNHITKMTQTSIEINDQLHFSQV